MTEPKIWYVVVKGKADGPYAESDMKQKLINGGLSYSDMVFRPGLSKWVPMSECKEFERRNEDRLEKVSSAAGLTVPDHTEEERDGWIALVKQTNADGKKHYIQSGPYTTEQIQSKLDRSEMQYEDHVWRKGLKAWKPVNTFPEFERRAGVNAETVIQPKPRPSSLTEKEEESEEHKPVAPSPLVIKPPESLKLKDKPPMEAPKFLAKEPPKEFPKEPPKEPRKEAAKKIFAPAPKETEPVREIPDTRPLFDEDISVVTDRKDFSELQETAADFEEPPVHDVSHIAKEAGIKVKEKKLRLPLPQLSNKRKIFVGTMGLAIGGFLTYAAMNAYNETQEPPKIAQRKARSNFPVRTQEAPKVSAPEPVAIQAVNPELENRLPKEPKVLKIVSLKTGDDNPQVVLETDLPGGSEIQVKVIAEPGAILKYPHFELIKTVNVVSGRLPAVDLKGEHLPDGDYKVTASGANLEATGNLSLGDRSADFRQRLAAFRAQVAGQKRKERSVLDEGVRYVSRSYSSLSQDYKKARTQPRADAKKKWTAMIRSWRKDFDKKAGVLKQVDEKKKNYFVYPDALMRLKVLESQLSDVAKTYNDSITQGRAIASEQEMDQTFSSNLKELREFIRQLK